MDKCLAWFPGVDRATAGWEGLARLVRGTGAAAGEADDGSRVLTVSRNRPALVALDHDGKLLERIEDSGQDD